jgi:hypothetical protein
MYDVYKIFRERFVFFVKFDVKESRSQYVQVIDGQNSEKSFCPGFEPSVSESTVLFINHTDILLW